MSVIEVTEIPPPLVTVETALVPVVPDTPPMVVEVIEDRPMRVMVTVPPPDQPMTVVVSKTTVYVEIQEPLVQVIEIGGGGVQGPPGPGVPVGGDPGQVLAKKSGSNYDTEWIDPPAGGGIPEPGEVFVGPDDPGIESTVELWYDTDELIT